MTRLSPPITEALRRMLGAGSDEAVIARQHGVCRQTLVRAAAGLPISVPCAQRIVAGLEGELVGRAYDNPPRTAA